MHALVEVDECLAQVCSHQRFTENERKEIPRGYVPSKGLFSRGIVRGWHIQLHFVWGRGPGTRNTAPSGCVRLQPSKCGYLGIAKTEHGATFGLLEGLEGDAE